MGYGKNSGDLKIGTTATDAAAGNKGVTNGDNHNHTGGAGATIPIAGASIESTDGLAGTSIPDGWVEVAAGTGTIDWTTEGELDLSVAAGSTHDPTAGTAPFVAYDMEGPVDVVVQVYVSFAVAADGKYYQVALYEQNDSTDTVNISVQYNTGAYRVYWGISGGTTGNVSLGAITSAWVALIRRGTKYMVLTSTAAEGARPALSDMDVRDTFDSDDDPPMTNSRLVLSVGNFGGNPASTVTFSEMRWGRQSIGASWT